MVICMVFRICYTHCATLEVHYVTQVEAKHPSITGMLRGWARGVAKIVLLLMIGQAVMTVANTLLVMTEWGWRPISTVLKRPLTQCTQWRRGRPWAIPLLRASSGGSVNGIGHVGGRYIGGVVDSVVVVTRKSLSKIRKKEWLVMHVRTEDT
jgi:hypothetical protein